MTGLPQLNATHDPARRSWVESANSGSDFPIQNLPLGVFHRGDGKPRGGVAIGDAIFDLKVALEAGLFSGPTEVAARAAASPTLNPLMALGNEAASVLRARLCELLDRDCPERTRLQAISGLLVAQRDTMMVLPAAIAAFSDFMASIYHTERGGRISRPDSPVPPVFKYMPIAYNSRASSVRLSGEAVARPNGQYRPADGTVEFGPSRWLDFEFELGGFVALGNRLGAPVPLASAPDHLFGYCLLNDWSARDIQRWESHPLGPFLSKSVSTTISPWIVTAEALAPFRAPAFHRAEGDPAPLPYLSDPTDQREGSLDLGMEAFLLTAKMREAGDPPFRITKTNFKHMYWTFGQMLTHHTSNGCNLAPGDLLGSGTVSGPTDESRACIRELTVAGTEPIHLPNGETRPWLLDGDEVIFRAQAARDGFVSIGFGECRGRIDPAPRWPERYAH
jgi:fumarylacetoacetase